MPTDTPVTQRQVPVRSLDEAAQALVNLSARLAELVTDSVTQAAAFKDALQDARTYRPGLAPPEIVKTPTPNSVPFSEICGEVAAGRLVLIGVGSTKLEDMKWLRVLSVGVGDSATAGWLYDSKSSFDLQRKFGKHAKFVIEAVAFFRGGA